MGFLQKFAHHVNPAAGCQSSSQKRGATLPNGVPNGARIQPKSMKNRARAHLGQQWAAKRGPRAPKKRPRRAQAAPKRRPRAPKSAPRAPKSRSRGARETSKPRKNQPRSAPGPHFHALMAENLVQEAVGPIFVRFLRRALDGRHAPMCVLYHSCQCFVGVGASTPHYGKSMQRHAKTLKNRALGPPKPSPERARTFQNRAESAPGRIKTGQERQENAARSAKCV